LALEVSQLGQPVTFGGTSQPTIGTRTISSNIRLKDGETNFLAGLYRTDRTRSKTDIPFLSSIPVLGRLFSDRNVSSTSTDLVLTLTPHIIRIPDITEEDLAPLYVGTDQNISFAGTPRIETPGVPGPFDFQRPTPAPPVVPGRPTPPPGINLAPGGGPSDIFRQVPTQPPPQTTPAPRPFSEPVVIPSGPPLTFDFDPGTLPLRAGQQRSVLVRASGEDTVTNTSIVIRFDPSIVAATSVRPILADTGVADAHIEKDRVVIEIPSAVALSGTRAVAEIVIQGVKAGVTALTFEQPSPSVANRTDATVQVK